MMFVGLGLSGVVPIIQGAFIYGIQGLEDRMSLSWTALHGAMYIFGAFLYAVCLLIMSSIRLTNSD
jgi:adiponectin receptor